MASEKRLIDLEKALKAVMLVLRGRVNTPTAVRVSCAMSDATVDAVEVVRCKDCKWYKTAICSMHNPYEDYPWHATNHDDFCSYGERRAGE